MTRRSATDAILYFSWVIKNPISSLRTPVIHKNFSLSDMMGSGRNLQTGDVMLVPEAMKMETNITAPGPGRIAAIPVNEGDSVRSRQVVMEFE